ncbi:LysR family transcriptional regulator [Aliiroseovarius sp. F47248L]|uniref:LysR family transcriptional regulator n=1 Tax=Aliiroseovarius sp. F47248L TaxID=2926420 RepID=UPI001FF19556|nr:LysR family transcriptional regulator [Aliiroseovarius sp. F47248L]MCK0138264.1 LysR family transcriptional regulator [Aliiroseovarius sp. F47248L]
MVETAGRITLWGVEVFVAAADERSISVAARRLGASPSSVSQQLTNLESALGTTLLDRSARPMNLTPAGALFLKRAQAILNEAEQARAELALGAMSQLSRLRLGMIEDFDADVTPRLLSELAGDMQSTRFLLETGASHRLHDQLDARALDVIIAADTGASADWMEVHALMEEPFVAAVPRGVIDHADPTTTLRNLPLVQYTARHHMGRVISDHLARQNIHLNNRFELDSYHAIMAMVAAGAGWTIITPLGFFHAQRFRAQTELIELPFAPMTRRINLTAREGVLGNLPHDMAARARTILSDLIVDPAAQSYPWLRDKLVVL